jgi:hypothetical protein
VMTITAAVFLFCLAYSNERATRALGAGGGSAQAASAPGGGVSPTRRRGSARDENGGALSRSLGFGTRHGTAAYLATD